MKKIASSSVWTERAQRLVPLMVPTSSSMTDSRGRLDRRFEFDVALSFAGENRKEASELAEELRKQDIKVFYDDWEKSWLWGQNLYDILTDLYQNQARYCILLISQKYVEKGWTNLERSAAQARAFKENREYILPVRIENVDVPGLLETVGYLDWKREGALGIAEALKVKLSCEVR